MWLAIWLGKKLEAEMSEGEIVLKVMYHDELEAVFGDRPSPSKICKISEVMTAEEAFLKLADLLEAILFLASESTLGNNAIQDVLKFVRLKFEKVCDILNTKQLLEGGQGTTMWVKDKIDSSLLLGEAMDTFSVCRHPVMEFSDYEQS